MEPSFLRKSVSALVAVLAIVVALSGCRPAVNVPPENSATQPDWPRQPEATGPPSPNLDEKMPETAASGSEEPRGLHADAPSGFADETVPQEGPGPAPIEGTQPERRALAEQAEIDEQPHSQNAESGVPAPEDPASAAASPGRVASADDDLAGEPAPPTPLVDDPDSLQPLHPTHPIWIDRRRNWVVMVGTVCQRRVPLELFACLRGSKEHESVVSVATEAYVVHAGLLALGAEPGSPVQFVPEFTPPSGTEIEVTVVWEDEHGRRRTARGQDWVRDVAEMFTMFEGLTVNQYDEELNPGDQFAAWKEMEYPWVFAGSQFYERDGRPRYLADTEGDLICVSNFPSAVLDVPVLSDPYAALLFDAFTERIPPLGTPVTVILSPKPGHRIDGADANNGHAQSEPAGNVSSKDDVSEQ